MSYKQLTQDQRYQIYEMKLEGKSQRKIAEKLKVAPSTISRELRRNRGGKGYRPGQAHKKAMKRRYLRRRPLVFTGGLKQRVIQKLKIDWSPAQISGWLKKQGGPTISHEWIYLHVWADKAQGGTLYTHLRQAHRKHRKRYGQRDRRGRIPGQISIEKRPAVVEKRKRLGDWEVDTVQGRQDRQAIVSAVDRRSRYTELAKVESRQADSVARAVVKSLKPHPSKTITSDNGREFAAHAEIAEALEANFYFAHPFHSWERGTNENTNGLIQQYLTKGRSLDNITRKELRFIMNRLNHRPRKCLGFKTPAEVHYSRRN